MTDDELMNQSFTGNTNMVLTASGQDPFSVLCQFYDGKILFFLKKSKI